MSKLVKAFFIALILIATALLFSAIWTDQSLTLSERLLNSGMLILVMGTTAGFSLLMFWVVSNA